MHTRLALDCSTTGLTIALRTPTGKIFDFSTREARSSDLLPTALATLFVQSGTTAANLTHVYVTTGPGSFTGIRLGLATAEALKLVNPALAIIGLSTLHACALQHATRHPQTEDFTIVQDAAGGSFYAQTFTAAGRPHTAASCVPAATHFPTPVFAAPSLMLTGARPLADLSAASLFPLAEDPATHLPPQPVYIKPLTYKTVQ